MWTPLIGRERPARRRRRGPAPSPPHPGQGARPPPRARAPPPGPAPSRAPPPPSNPDRGRARASQSESVRARRPPSPGPRLARCGRPGAAGRGEPDFFFFFFSVLGRGFRGSVVLARARGSRVGALRSVAPPLRGTGGNCLGGREVPERGRARRARTGVLGSPLRPGPPEPCSAS